MKKKNNGIKKGTLIIVLLVCIAVYLRCLQVETLQL